MIQSEFTVDADTLFDNVIKIVTIAGYSVQKTDRTKRAVQVRTPMTLTSYGVKLAFMAEPLGERKSILRVEAKPVVFTNLTAKPEEVARQIIGYIEGM